jgi:hypothetical protein
MDPVFNVLPLSQQALFVRIVFPNDLARQRINVHASLEENLDATVPVHDCTIGPRLECSRFATPEGVHQVRGPDVAKLMELRTAQRTRRVQGFHWLLRHATASVPRNTISLTPRRGGLLQRPLIDQLAR